MSNMQNNMQRFQVTEGSQNENKPPNVQNASRGYYVGPDFIRGVDGSYAMRYTRTTVDWRGKTAMTYAPKLVGQPTIYEMKLDVTSQKVK